MSGIDMFRDLEDRDDDLWLDPTDGDLGSGDVVAQVYGQASPHRVIRASAGSGKTYQLTTRYLRLLRHHAAPESILATTFTRKAAGEILGRVLGRLAMAATDAQERRTLSSEVGGAPLSEADCKAMLVRLARALHRLSISTIDSFFNRMAQGFRFELDLPVNPQLVDEKHPLAAQLRQQAIEAMLADDDLATLLTLLRRLHHDAAARSVTRAIDDIVCDHYEAYRQAPNRELWATLAAAALLTDEALRDAVTALGEAATSLPEDQRWHKAFAKNLEAALRQTWDDFLGTGLAKAVAEGGDRYYNKPMPAGLLTVLETLVGHAQAVQIDRVAKQTEATFDLLKRFDFHYTRLRRGYRLLLFSDLTHKLARLLPTLGDQVLADVYYRLDGRVAHLLLDEFQDTSVDQWTVLTPLAEDVASYSDGSRSLFCVGDVKQAIYGWRGGCAELFDQVEAMAGEAVGLAVSWRSSQVVLDAVNQVFGDIRQNPAMLGAQDAAQQWCDCFEAHEAAKDLPGYVELMTSCAETGSPQAGEDDEEETFGSHEAYAAKRVRAIHQAAPGRSIGVLVATNRMVNLMLHELRRLHVPVSGEAGNPVTDSPAVAAVLAALTLADHPGHTAAAFHVLNSPMGSVVGLRSLEPRETARVAMAIRRSLLVSGYAGTLAQWVRTLAPSCGPRNLTRLTQLVALAERYEPTDSLRPGRFVAFVEATPVEEPTPAPVRVMTIHASKGLEFDAVVLPQLDRQLRKSPALLTARDEPTGPIRAVYRCPAAAVRQLMPQVQEAYETYQHAQRQEDLCSLYVAMTRARHALHMIVKPLVPTTRGGPGSRGWSNLSFATIVRRALSDRDESYDGDEVLYERGDPHWARHVDGETVAQDGSTSQAAGEAVRVKLSAAAGKRRRGVARVTPSSLHGGGRLRASELLRLDAGDGAAYGRLVHRWLEAVTFVDESGLPDDAELLRLAGTEGVTPARAREALTSFHEMLAKPEVHQALCRQGASELWQERSFAVRMDGMLLHGQFDRVSLFQGVSGGVTGATLIDFKTDRVTGSGIDARLEHYRPQLVAYRRALARMLSLNPGQIETKVLFLQPGVMRSL